MDQTAVASAVEWYVRAALEGRDASHDMAHIERVRAVAVTIANSEGLSEEQLLVVELGALLHDIADWKYEAADNHGGRSVEALIQDLLVPLGVTRDVISRVCDVVAKIGFKEELRSADGREGVGACQLSIEAKVVQDADRLDAIGAIGIARCFTFGGSFGRPLYDPSVPPRTAGELTQEAYIGGHCHGQRAAAPPEGRTQQQQQNGDHQRQQKQEQQAAPPPTLNHFYEKLLTLKGRMKTAAGRAMAEGRHAFMESYLDQFWREVRGDA